MQKILLIGAGRSASSLIRYLLDHASECDWEITVADVSLEMAQHKTGQHPRAKALAFDMQDEAQRSTHIQAADLVISMLPATMHMPVAHDCVRYKKHLVTASYVSPAMKALHEEAKNAGIILMNEIGLDPGIDHASAMQIIDSVRDKGGEVVSFKSYCGGLVAPESNDNPWGYKFTWNPRNVILAGQSTAQYLNEGHLRFIPYTRIFSDIDTIQVEGHGQFDAYANRDSLSYIEPYGLQSARTLLRGTLRHKGFCEQWNGLVKIGLTDDTFIIEQADQFSYRQLVESFLPSNYDSFEDFAYEELSWDKEDAAYKAIAWTGLLSDEKIRLKRGTPAQLLQDLLERKWLLQPEDKDMIVMQHLIEYQEKGSNHLKKISSSLVVKGEDQVYTAMAKTVGLPAAIAAKLILQGKIKARGVVIPTIVEIYAPLLKELEEMGIRFEEKIN